MYMIKTKKITELFSLIAKEQNIYAPIEKNNKVEFNIWKENETLCLDVLNTVRSPKDFFFPQSENLVEFKMKDKNIEIVPESIENVTSVYFGVKACDVRSIEILDKVFLNDPIDTFYANKRKNGIIISLACNNPDKTCFCDLFNIDPSNPSGDIATWIIDDNLYWKSITEKGKKLTEKVKALFEDGDSDLEIVEEHNKSIKRIINTLPLNDLSLEDINEDTLNKKFNDNIWSELYQACIGCGTCTYICPTCHCYDICDFDKGKSIQRFRCWDSCMYSDFTMMSHGNNRKTQMERFRQRFMHKLFYFPANNEGEYACVGCGRCLEKCPVSMNIVKVIKALGGSKDE